MADIHPLKYIFDKSGEIIALSEMGPNDSIPTRYLNLSAQIDGGTMIDTFSHVIEAIDGGHLMDVYDPTTIQYTGGEI